MTHIASVSFLGVLVFGFCGPALADRTLAKSGSERSNNDRISKEKAAKKACATGDYQKGVDILADLFVDTNDAVYIYNQGRCYQQNNRWEQAISRFREFLRKDRRLSESERAETQRQIDDCQTSLNQAASMAPPPVPPPMASPPMPAPSPPPVPVSAPTAVESKPLPPPDESRGKGLRIAGIVVASVGVAAIGTGVGLALKANSLSTSTYSKSREDERSSLKTWSLVTYGVGGAAIATGVVLYVIGWNRQSSSNLAFIPAVAADGASLSLRGRF